jgi:hypothetical protein
MIKLRESVLTRVFPATISGNRLGNIHWNCHFWGVCKVNFLHTFETRVESIMFDGFSSDALYL